MDETTKNELLRQFRDCLDQLPEGTMEEISAEGGTDLYTLFVELAALKNEVKIESRQVKSALDEFKLVFETLQEAQSHMSVELTRSRKDRDDLSHVLLRPLLLDLLELHDRLSAGLSAATSHRRSLLARLSRRENQMFRGLRDGQKMTLRRLEAILASCQVRPMDVVGRKFDPSYMLAAETENQPHLDDGVVTVELRKGFFWDESPLRIPEVKINKINKECE
jgi:molecular chaperone GrpE